MMNELGWKPLNERRKEQRLVLLFKIVNDLVAIPADNNIEYNQRPSRTSNSKQIKVPSATTEIYKLYFFPKTVNDWNTLTESAVSSKTVKGFKAAISRKKVLNADLGKNIDRNCIQTDIPVLLNKEQNQNKQKTEKKLIIT